jgi:3-hydroxymyristoyl/3-hydroxydecanoyl-(acyl carrier protein) dehydratase
MIDLDKDLNQSFQLLELTDNKEARVRLIPHESWTYFQGHFPSMPVLPAVAIADISRFFIEKYILKKSRPLKKLSFFKLKTPVQPARPFILHLQTQNENTFQVVWKDESDGALSAEMVMEFNEQLIRG